MNGLVPADNHRQVTILFLFCTNITLSHEGTLKELPQTHGNQHKHSSPFSIVRGKQILSNTHTHTERLYKEDIPGMLLFDGDLLRVDCLVDAHSLCRGGSGGKEERDRKYLNQGNAFHSSLEEHRTHKILYF